MTLADTIVASLMAETWTTITEPVLTVRSDKRAELKLGTGWVDSYEEVITKRALGGGLAGQRETEFEIYIACATDANYVLYQSNIETFINGKTVAGGWWEITEYLHEDTLHRHDFHCKGKQVKWGTS